eukprot:4929297-Pyramimonas_sp.AAC.1
MSPQGVPSPRNQTRAAHVKLQTRLLASMPSSTSQQNPRWLHALRSSRPGCLGVPAMEYWWGCKPDV